MTKQSPDGRTEDLLFVFSFRYKLVSPETVVTRNLAFRLPLWKMKCLNGVINWFQLVSMEISTIVLRGLSISLQRVCIGICTPDNGTERWVFGEVSHEGSFLHFGPILHVMTQNPCLLEDTATRYPSLGTESSVHQPPPPPDTKPTSTFILDVPASRVGRMHSVWNLSSLCSLL